MSAPTVSRKTAWTLISCRGETASPRVSWARLRGAASRRQPSPVRRRPTIPTEPRIAFIITNRTRFEGAVYWYPVGGLPSVELAQRLLAQGADRILEKLME